MGINDDLRELGELAKMVGDDGAPLPEFKAVLENPTVTVVGDEPAPAPAAAPVEPSGGDPAPLDLDALLGLSKPVAAPEPEKTGGKPAPESSEPAPGSADARIKELTDLLKRERDEKDLLLKRALGDQPAPQQTGPESEAPVLDEPTREFLAPYIKAEVDRQVAERVAPLEQDVAPLRQQQKDIVLAQALSKVVAPGFTAEHVKKLHEEYATVTDEDMRAVYADGLAGAAALAHSLISRGVLDLAGSKPRTKVNPLVARHSTPSGGPTGAVDEARDEDAKVRAILSTSNEAWLDALRRRGFDD